MNDSMRCLSALHERVEQIVEYHKILPKSVGSSEVIAHFTSWAACEAIVSSSRDEKGAKMWANNADCLNDPLEGRALFKYLTDVVNRDGANPTRLWPLLPETLDTVNELYGLPKGSLDLFDPRLASPSDVYLTSFCSLPDRLDLWRAYGDDGQGVSLVMPLADAVKALRSTKVWGFFRVLYEDADMKRAWLLLQDPLRLAWKAADKKNGDVARSILKAIGPVLHLYKHKEYSSESEVRLIYRGPRPRLTMQKVRGELRPIVKTSPFFLRGSRAYAILGPRTPDRRRRRATLRGLLRLRLRAQSPDVKISDVPYQ